MEYFEIVYGVMKLLDLGHKVPSSSTGKPNELEKNCKELIEKLNASVSVWKDENKNNEAIQNAMLKLPL